jgi:flagellar hook-associated protein 1 FlgK
MASTFFGLTISASGLRAANAALNTTANNVSNEDTEGYSRQQVITEAADALRTFTTYGCSGAGVNTLAIERVRDTFYDEKYRTNETALGEQNQKQYYCTMLEDYFKDDGKSGFNTIFNSLTSDLQEISKDSNSTSTKTQYLSQMKTMTDYFNNLSGNLQKLQSDVNTEIKTQADSINSIAQELATINKQINVIELTGTTANELRDKRDNLLDELSKIVDIKTSEQPVYDTKGNDTGATRFKVMIAGGQTLVDQNDYNQLTAVARKSDEKVNQSDIDGLFDFYWNDGTEFKLDNAALKGSLKGLAEMRDGKNGEYFTGTVSSVGTASDGNHTVSITTDADYLCDMSKCTLSDNGGKINIGNTIYKYSDWTYSYDSSTKKATYTFTMKDDECDTVIGSDKVGSTGTIGSNAEYEGIPYYMEQMNEWARDFSKALNSIFTSGVTTDNNDAGIVLTGDLATDKGQYTEAQLSQTTTSGVTTGKGYYYITASDFAVNSDVLKDSNLLGTRADSSEGKEECTLVTKALNMLSDKSTMTFRGGTAGQFLQSVLSDTALNASNANTFSKMYTTLENTIKNQRTSVSGVDADTEGVNMVKYQNSYTLSSKMISTLTEVYDRLILETGV